MQINLSIELNDEATKHEVVAAIREAASRAAGQIEHDIIPYPLEFDDQVLLIVGDEELGVEAALFRSA